MSEGKGSEASESQQSKVARPTLKQLLAGDIDSKSTPATAMLILYCWMTGFTSVITFSACYIWCGFQTGGVAQLAIAVARNFASGSFPGAPRTYIFEHPDIQALTSLLSFLLGSAFGRIGDRYGNATRGWLVTATLLQAVFVACAAITSHFSGESSFATSRGEPSWITPLSLAALGFASASMGLQGIVGKRLPSQLGTTVVLTTVWVELINDPSLHVLKAVPTRDHRAYGVFALFVGGIIGRAILQEIGSAKTFAICAGLRVINAGLWLIVPGKPQKALP